MPRSTFNNASPMPAPCTPSAVSSTWVVSLAMGCDVPVEKIAVFALARLGREARVEAVAREHDRVLARERQRVHAFDEVLVQIAAEIRGVVGVHRRREARVEQPFQIMV